MAAVISLSRGRPRKPDKMKELAGTARKDRVNPKAPAQQPSKLLPPPRGLTAGERAAWFELARVLEPMRVATDADLVAFRQMAVTLAVINDAKQALDDAKGLTYTLETESGTVVRKRPEVEILLAYKRQLSVELSRFGLTPADRSRVSALGDEGRGNDPLAEFELGGAG